MNADDFWRGGRKMGEYRIVNFQCRNWEWGLTDGRGFGRVLGKCGGHFLGLIRDYW